MNAAPNATILRMIDANANRAREALRVMEDYARFSLNDEGVSGELKQIRHGLAGVMGAAALRDAVLFRDTAGDVGRTVKTEAELRRESLGAVVVAAGKRLSEALRVLEECLKTVEGGLAETIERLRYRGYVVEQTLARRAGGTSARERFGKVRVYVLLTEALCHPTLGGWERTLEIVLGAAPTGELLCVQLREKALEGAELLRRAKIVAGKCRAAGAVSIVNDRADIAVLADADGVHLGQADLPCAEARRLLGSEKIIGVSTENIAQARQALQAGATYLGVGPMFPTTTKDKSHLAVLPGPAYAAEALRELPNDVPLVPIGGIHAGNMAALAAVGMQRVCVCSAVISVAEPAAAIGALLGHLRA